MKTSTKARTSTKPTATVKTVKSVKSSASTKAGASVKPTSRSGSLKSSTSAKSSTPATASTTVKAGDSIPDQRGIQPSSLTRPGARNGLVCPSCGSHRLTTLGMTLTDGTPVSFSSCHNCEHRVWCDEAGRLEFTDVLTRATKRKAS